jgi:hypothetical protein
MTRRAGPRLWDTPQWRKVRKQMLEAYPFCAKCGTADRLTVHHAAGYADPFIMAGLVVLCQFHHGQISRAQQLRMRGKRPDSDYANLYRPNRFEDTVHRPGA